MQVLKTECDFSRVELHALLLEAAGHQVVQVKLEIAWKVQVTSWRFGTQAAPLKVQNANESSRKWEGSYEEPQTCSASLGIA